VNLLQEPTLSSIDAHQSELLRVRADIVPGSPRRNAPISVSSSASCTVPKGSSTPGDGIGQILSQILVIRTERDEA
jgi:hypothetical protein